MHPNERVIRTAAGAVAKGDLAGWSTLVADDCLFHFAGRSQISGEFKGKDEFVDGFFAKVLELTDSFSLEIHDVVASDDHAVGIYLMRAERDQKLFEWRHVNVYHIKGGKVVEVWLNPFEQTAVDEFFS